MSSEPSQGTAKERLLDAHLQELGRSLSAAREARGQSVEELARRLRMGVEQLRALEEADRRRLPEMVFVIAQARRVASSLDLCVDERIDALRQGGFSSIPSLAGLMDAGEPSETNADPSAAVGDTATPSRADDPVKTPHQFNPGSHLSGQDTSHGASPEPAQPAPEPSQTTPTLERHSRQTSGQPVPWVRPVATVALLAGIASAGFALWRHGVPSLAHRPGVPAAGQSGHPSPSSPGSTLLKDRLLLSSKEPSWLEVQTPNGDNLHYGLLQGEQSFTNQAGLQVRAGRPDLITVRAGDGAPRPLGTIDDLNWWTIHPDGRITPVEKQPTP
jgi:cytoskeletal protein RodZ